MDKFIADGIIQKVSLSTRSPDLQVYLGDLSSYGSGVIGLCEQGTNFRKITISTTFWNKVGNTQKELLLHHELGHCVLYRPHRSEKFTDGNPKSIMYPVIMADKTYLGNYDYYQNELFTWKAQGKTRSIYICEGADQ